RDILSRWRTAHIHVRRPSGVPLPTQVQCLAALDELRGFKLEPELMPKLEQELAKGSSSQLAAPRRHGRNHVRRVGKGGTATVETAKSARKNDSAKKRSRQKRLRRWSAGQFAHAPPP
ncbi:hypothetical protein, partial [Lysobacter sp. Root690]|uniref:hypothetical protein n=1 Tax=Lysobacter sp. Root690 TaxID=1736588 RepID=UPI001F3E1BAC